MIEPRIVVALANSVWQSAILVVFTVTLLRIMNRTSANLRYAVWLATLAVCVLLPVLDYGSVKHLSEPAATASHSLRIPGTAAGATTESQYVITPGETHFSPQDARTHVHSNGSAGTSATRVFTLSPAARRSAIVVPSWLQPATWVFFSRALPLTQAERSFGCGSWSPTFCSRA